MDITKQMLATMRDLVSINTVQAEPLPGAPFGKGVRDALDYTLALCRNMGFTVKDVDGYCGWAEVGEGDLFGVLAHLDTVPLGKEGWRVDPLSCDVIDGEIYGRGVVDDKGPLVNAIYAVKALLDEGKTPKKRIRFIIGCNEETEWRCIDRYLLSEEIPVQAISPDGDYPVINCEKGLGHYELTMPCPACIQTLTAGDRVNMVPDKAYCVLNEVSDLVVSYALNHNIDLKKEGDKWVIRTTGKAAHGSTPYLGENALLKIIDAIASEDALLKTLSRAFSAYDGSLCNIGFRDDVSGGLTMTVGYAKTEEGLLKLGLDIRFPVTFSNENVQKGLQTAFPFAEVTLVHAHPCLYFAEDDPFVQSLLDAYKSVTGDTAARPQTIGGATYARAIPNTLAFGPVFPNRENLCHQVNERVSLEDFEANYLILKKAFETLCF